MSLDSWLDEANVPESIAKVFPGSIKIPTTDEMDHTTPEERYKLVAICSSCHKPHYFTGSAERSGSQTKGEVCECGGTSFYDMRSERTFNPAAKGKIPKPKH